MGGTLVGGMLGLLVGVGALAIPGIGPVLAAGTLASMLGATALGAGIGAAAGGIVGALVGAGVPEEDAHVYVEGVRQGGTLITVTVTDETADAAVATLERHEPVDVDVRGSEFRASGWQRFEPDTPPPAASQDAAPITTAAPPSDTTARRPSMLDADSVALPVVEEQLSVGKREVQGGGVRARTRVIETPVQEQASLRDDTVRRRDVEVERTVGEATSGASGTDFEGYDNDFRTYYSSNLASSGYSYEQYAPVFRYGYDLRNDQRYQGKDWSAIEADVRGAWEESNPGTWEQFRGSIRYAWDCATDKR